MPREQRITWVGLGFKVLGFQGSGFGVWGLVRFPFWVPEILGAVLS